MVNVQNFLTLVACQKNLDKHPDTDQTASEEAVWSESALFAILITILWVPALKTKILYENRERKSVQNFRTFIAILLWVNNSVSKVDLDQSLKL